tara:strand:+ start:244 stop:468 length:225 start_codon:yes stop_codon:yes gene_type:complete
MSKDKLISIIRENHEQSNFYRNKLVIEVNHVKETASFWETTYTFDQILQFVFETPELCDKVHDIMNDNNFKDEK